MKLGELFFEIGAKTGNTINTLTGVGFKFLTLKKTAEELSKVFENMFGDTMRYAVDLANTNKITGISIKQMQEMKYKAEQVGVSYESWLGSVKAIQKGMADINMGNDSGLMSLLQKLDLDPRQFQDSADLLNGIMSKAMQYEEGYRRALLAEGGISEEMIVMYSEKYKSIKGSLLLTTEELAQQKELNREWEHLTQTAGAFWNKGVVGNHEVFETAIKNIEMILDKFMDISTGVSSLKNFVIATIDIVGMAIKDLIDGTLAFGGAIATGVNWIKGLFSKKENKDMKKAFEDRERIQKQLQEEEEQRKFDEEERKDIERSMRQPGTMILSQNKEEMAKQIASLRDYDFNSSLYGLSPINTAPTSNNKNVSQTNNISIYTSNENVGREIKGDVLANLDTAETLMR